MIDIRYDGSVEAVRWGGQRDANEGPVVILLLCVHLLTIVLTQVSLCQTRVHLLEDQALSALLGTDKTNHEALLDTEAEDALNIGANDFQMHEADQAVLEQISRHLVDVLALVVVLLLKSDELTTLSLPSVPVVNERLGKDAKLAASLDNIVELWLVHDCVIDLVVFTIFDTSHSQTRNDS